MRTRLARFVALAIVLALGPKIASAQIHNLPPVAAPSSANATAYQFDVNAAKKWIDTQVDLRQGEKLRLSITKFWWDDPERQVSATTRILTRAIPRSRRRSTAG